MDKNIIIKEIDQAFQSEKYPGDDYLVYDNSGKHLECEYIKKVFQGKTWKSLPDNFLFEEISSLSFFSPQAYKYYLPAFLIYSVNDFYGSDEVPFQVISSLTLPSEIDTVLLANKIYEFKIQQQMNQLDFNQILQNDLALKNKSIHFFVNRASLFSREQGRAVNNFLEYINKEYSSEFFNNEPKIAMERYWFQFSD